MPRAQVNGIELEYELLGQDGDEPLLLVMGLGAQLVAWDDEFCMGLVDRGFQVCRYDNRDAGLSTKIDDATPYTIETMADDAAGLLDAIGWPSAHVVGASMGGMIVQALAIRHPARVRSLTSIMSTTGDPAVGQPTPEAMQALLTPPASDREGRIEQGVETTRLIAPDTPQFPFDADRVRERSGQAYDRSFCPDGVARQLQGILASPDRTAGLRNLTVPTLVIHGSADTLVTPSGGEATAAAIPGAELLMIEGMGHALPPQAWATVIEAITRLAQRANQRGDGAHAGATRGADA